MIYTTRYDSPVGELMIAADEEKITGLWIHAQKYYASTLPPDSMQKPELLPLKTACEWLDNYFAGKKPSISELTLAPMGGEFRQSVWEILCGIPYGTVTTYGAIATLLAKKTNRVSVSAQAVGGAVGHNPISIIIPCHRVVGMNGSLTGYAGGIDKKIQLLKHEGVDMSHLFIPKCGTAM